MIGKRSLTKILLLVVAIVLILGLISGQLLGIVWIPALGGLCFISAPFGTNENQSYSVIFHSVNFTFLGSTYDYGNLTDAPSTAHFLITFNDGQKENLTLHYGGFIPIAVLFIEYHWNITNHVSLRAGVITGNSWILYNRWQFLVFLR